jgi:NADPH-dependent 2,4-dienoyl-CoA reductase/sulfur reductase-like enzyme
MTSRVHALNFEAVVIGAGPAGLAAAVSLKTAGIRKVLVVEREPEPGGILLQCIHNGFGLHRFSEELTGPEYAERYVELAEQAGIDFLYNAIVLDILPDGGGHRLPVLCEGRGLLQIEAKAVILAMGCRERSRGNINIPGSRPAGVMTAGLAQKLVNILGYLPGKEAVILGSGDIGLIMARRLTWEGVRVKAVVEVQPFPGGLARNIVQCLNDFNIPLYLSHTVSNIFGNRRVEAVEVSPIDGHLEPKREGRFLLTCDTLLLSVGLIPENELSTKAGAALHPVTGGPLVDGNLMTSVPGLFACGNVLHVHDLVDWVSEEAETAGRMAARYIRGELAAGREIAVRGGNLVRYVLPASLKPGEEATVSLRPITPAEDVMLSVRAGDRVLFRRKYRRVLPSSMLRIKLKELPSDVEALEIGFAPAGEAPAAAPEEDT